MDFGVITLQEPSPNPDSSEPDNSNSHGSVNLKQERSEIAEDTGKESKIARNGSFTAFGRFGLWPSGSDDGQKMLSFSSADLHPNEGNITKYYSRTGVGWGPLHLGLSSSKDPEPWRCRRTDGKKWRCSKDAVPDQKYCERHINRCRNRSRKPVEGLKGHAVSGSTTSNVAPIASSSSASVISRSSLSNNLGSMLNQLNPCETHTAQASIIYPASSDKNVYGRTQEYQSLTSTPTTINLKPKDTSLSFQNQHAPFEEFAHLEFGTNSDSRVNPSTKFSYLNARNPNSFLDLESNDHHLVSHFNDLTDQSDHTSVSWAKKQKSDWTQLSMSIPVAPSDFSPSTDFSPQTKPTFLPLRLSPEPDPVQMSLGINSNIGESNQKQSTWLPVSWGISMGGPLGEVLTSTSTNAGVGSSSTVLNLMTEAG
ncbi:growth-regulating factor 1-like isoform X2 [Olea europaea var. sylvestris]|uniref:growth-regulating factor 1-like isoform X2 n=1 Tax=Olea europaea var. sylvestris TaxID=158386 RepID=UPI000C1D29B4|nr:growth-regulating factor 1-like isoform X2 [Olea europaea var. sylvestris]